MQKLMEVILGNNYLTDTMLKARSEGIGLETIPRKVVFSCLNCTFDVARIINLIVIRDSETTKTIMISEDNRQIIKQCPSCEGQILAYVVNGKTSP